MSSAKADVIIGNPSGNVTLVEYFDYQCPHCRRMEPIINSLIKAFPDLQIVYRSLPAFGDMSLYDAQLAIAAYKINRAKYTIFRHLLLTNVAPRHSAVLFLASEAGYDETQLIKVAHSQQVLNELQKNVRDFKSKDFQSVPTFVVKNAGSGRVTFVHSGELPGFVLSNAISTSMRNKHAKLNR